MAGSPETAAILDALNSQRADARERQAAMERQIREEARRLRGGVAGKCFTAIDACVLHVEAVAGTHVCCRAGDMKYFAQLHSLV